MSWDGLRFVSVAGWKQATVTNRAAPALRIDRLCKRIDGFEILDGVSFEVSDGEVVGLVGPNGAGKSTLMRVLAGLLEPSGGDAWVCGAQIGSPASRGALSLMPEEPDLYPALSVIEHVRFLDRINQVRSTTDSIELQLRTYGLSAKRDALPHELSQGMKRKLALILALRKGARVFLLDEPFNGLDPAAVADLRRELRELSRQGHSVLVSMHGLSELERFADRIVFLLSGRAVASVSLTGESLNEGFSLEDLYLELVGSLRENGS